MNIPLKGIPRSPGEQTLVPGDLVMFENEQTTLLGVILETKKDRFRVLSERNRDVELTAVRLHKLPGKMAGRATTREQQGIFLHELRTCAESEKAQVALEELWVVTRENIRDWSEQELSELLFGTFSLHQYAGLRIALLADRIYFKRDKFGFIPRTSEIVDELKRMEIIRGEKRALERETVEFFANRLSGTSSEIPERLRGMITLLEECAAGSERIDHGKQKEVKELLQLFSDQTKVELQGSLEERAFAALCRIGHFNRNTNLAIYRHNPRRIFSEVVEREALEIRVPESLAALNDTVRPHVLDLTTLKVCTIDDRSTKDMDDALSIEQTPEGYRLGVHISNVALLLDAGSGLEHEAVLRATSIYTPDVTINMLPSHLAEDKFSLCVGKVRPVVSCFFELDQRLQIVKSSLALALIKVTSRLSYDQVDEMLAAEDHDLSLLYNIASQCEQDRIERGAVKVQKGDATVIIGEDQRLSLVEIDEQSPARSLVGEMMVLANGSMARLAAEHGIPLIFRGQPAPDRGRKIDPRIPEGPARDYALRALLKKSTTGLLPQLHASLGLEAYAQVTSPIRRFADILNQRQLLDWLVYGKPRYAADQLSQLSEQLEEPLNKANQVSRESKRFWMLRYLEEYARTGKSIGGTIIRTDLKNPIVELEDTYLTLPVRTDRQINPGDHVSIRVVSVKPHEDQARLEIIG